MSGSPFRTSFTLLASSIDERKHSAHMSNLSISDKTWLMERFEALRPHNNESLLKELQKIMATLKEVQDSQVAILTALGTLNDHTVKLVTDFNTDLVDLQGKISTGAATSADLDSLLQKNQDILASLGKVSTVVDAADATVAQTVAATVPAPDAPAQDATTAAAALDPNAPGS
jgi:uncharacterized protein YoxC